MSKEAEAAACKWFMSELLPICQNALDDIAAGCLPGVNTGNNAKVDPTSTLCTAFQRYMWLSASGYECCRQGGDILQDKALLQAIYGPHSHHDMYACNNAKPKSAGSGKVHAQGVQQA